MARAALQIGVRQLADKAGLSSMTVTRFENGHTSGAPDTVAAIRRALESAGVEFIAENGGGAGVRLRKAPKEPEQPATGEGGIIDNNEM
jgi:transcriptional regulator with XRE-family HTH domain